MATDNNKRVLYNDGEGVTYVDLNDSQTYLEARIYDQILESLVGSVANSGTQDADLNGQRGANAPTHLAYCLHGGSAYLRQGTTNAKLQISPGVLIQKIASSTGDSPTFLAYTFAGTEEVAIANGNATNPRVDILQMKLELISSDTQTRDFKDATTGVVTSTTMSKKKRVQCTLSVKQGTPAASPTYPDPDPGYVAVAGVVVGATWAAASGFIFGEDTAGAVAVVHDQRMPLNVQAYHSDAALWKLISNWSLSAGNMYADCSNATNDIRVICDKSGNGRLVGLSVLHVGALGIVSLGHNALGTVWENCNNTPSIAAGTNYALIPYYDFEANHNPNAGPTVLPSSTNKIGPPLWTNGFRCARAVSSKIDAGVPEKLAFKSVNAGVGISIRDVIWYVAQGI